MNRHVLTLVAASIACTAVPLAAQQPQCARGVSVVDLGVTYAADGADEEPRISAVDAKGPAAGRLQKGDMISRVNGFSIAAPQAVAALREGAPGKAIVLTVRRSDRLVPVTVTPSRLSCTSMAALQPSRIAGMAPARTAAVNATSAREAVTVAGRMYAAPPGWLGIGFACSECEQRVTTAGRAWVFTDPPTIYNVDTGSPAYTAGIRRGDILLRVDGSDVRTPVAGARLAQALPGESLRLTYRRSNRTGDAVVRVGRSPVAAAERLEEPYARLQATQELRVSQAELDLRRIYTELEQSASAQRSLAAQLEKTLADGTSQTNRSARATLERLQRLQAESARNAQRAYETALRAREEGGNLIELRPFGPGQAARTMERTVEGGRVDTTIVLPRMDRLRYSGSIGDSDVEVRGAGSVNVQRVGDDLVIVTGDAVVRVTQRKARDGS